MLLVLDNFEQIISAAPFVTGLLASCPKLNILVSSRAVLRLRGEREFAVPPLALPDVDRLSGVGTLARCSAVELFVQRARGVKPDFTLNAENARAVAEVCVRLDGLPLAIELAASRIKLLPAQAILARLNNRLKLLTGGARDLPARQQTIRETIAWSYDLLEEDEKTLFRRLSVFVGGLSLEAAEEVSGGAGDLQTDVLEGVASLIDKSLLRQRGQEISEPRFGMLETIREYGLERLQESGERDALRGRHARFFLAIAEEAELGIRGPEQMAWYDRLEAEHNNLRSALEWFQSQGDAESGLRLMGALWWFWWRRAHLTEGRERLLSILSRANTSVPSVGLVKAFCGAGFLSLLQGDSTSAASLAAQSVKLARELGDRFLTAYALIHYGLIIGYGPASAPASSISAVKEGLKLFREIGNKWGIATGLNYLGEILRSQGDYERAAPVYEESLTLNREIGNTWAVVTSSVNLAWVALHQGDYKRAEALFKESLIPARDLKAPYIVSENLMALADVAIQAGDAERAARLLGASAGLSETTGYVLNPFDREVFDRYVASARGALDEERFSSAWAEGRAMTFEQAIAYALASADSPGEP
jgi:predicted ATPase